MQSIISVTTSIVFQVVVDGRKRFLDVSAGYPGSMHDARVLRNSVLFRRCESNEILQAPVMNVKVIPFLEGSSISFTFLILSSCKNITNACTKKLRHSF